MDDNAQRKVYLDTLVEMERIIKTMTINDQEVIRRAIRDITKLSKIYGENIGHMALLYSASKSSLDRKTLK